MLLFDFSVHNLDRPPGEIVAFVRRIIGQYGDEGRFVGENERRGEKRFRIALPVIARPLDEELATAGEAFIAVTKDLSPNGIALYHHDAIASRFMAVRLADRNGCKVTGVVEILRCRPVDHFYEIAGKFVTKIYDALARPPR